MTDDAVDDPDAPGTATSTGRHVFRAGTLAAGAVIVLQLLQQTIGAFDPRPVVSVLIVVAVFFTGLVAQRVGARRAQRAAVAARDAQLRQILGVWPPEELPKVDALRLGVFPARRDLDGSAPYVPRTVDEPLRAALVAGSVVLVYGPPRSGKSRTALEAITAARPGARVLAPRGSKAMGELLALDPPVDLGEVDSVVWLDGLDRYAGTMDALSLDGLAALTRGSTVVMTVRSDDWAELLKCGGDRGETARAVAARAKAFELPAQLDSAETAAARRAYPRVDLNGGIGTALAAHGTDLTDPPVRVATPVESRDPVGPGRRDPELIGSLAGAVAAVVAFALVWALAGFSTPPKPTIGDQVSDIKRDGSQGGRHAVVFPVDLHGSGDTSYVFLFQDLQGVVAHPQSDQLRVYDVRGGDLVLKLRFQPSGERAVYQFRSSADVDLDGKHEFIGGYGLAADNEQDLVPFAISWDDEHERYRLITFDLGAPALSRPPAASDAAPYMHELTFRDPGGASISGHPVQDFAVTTAPARLVAGYFLALAPGTVGQPYELHSATFDSNHGEPHVTPCQLPGRPFVVAHVASGRAAFKVIQDRWDAASRGKVCQP